MASLRQFAACIGVSAPFLVARDFFGLATGRCPQLAGAAPVLSVRDQIMALRGIHFHVNAIKVGSDLFTPSDFVEVDGAIHKARTIYKQVGVGIGRVRHFAIPVSLANGHEIIDNDDEAKTLTNEWTVHNNGLDVFIVRDYVGSTIGRSPAPGSCNKDDASDMTGSVVEISNGTQQTARSFAHEMGHYLGLGHENSKPENLMAQSSVPGVNTTTSVVLTADQGNTILKHCFMQLPCF
jgi:hypothetical protein